MASCKELGACSKVAITQPDPYLQREEVIVDNMYVFDETVIDAQGLLRSALITRFARGRRHGYDRASVRERLASRFYHERHHVDRTLHAITRNRMLTAQALGYAPDGLLDFGLDRAALTSGGPGREVVLLHATARPEKE